jgi:SAM-dependent methyltransferase/glycosyltransferase involved in cell wall biosynthesis
MLNEPHELYAYTDPAQLRIGYFSDPSLHTTSERHKIRIEIPVLRESVALLTDMLQTNGLVIGMYRGWPGLQNLRLAGKVLKRGRKVWFYWPDEEAIEVIDIDRLQTYWLLWAVITPLHYLTSRWLVARTQTPKGNISTFPVEATAASPMKQREPIMQSAEERAAIRREFGWRPTDRIIAFKGSFDDSNDAAMLAATVRDVCARALDARFLFIGNGAHRENFRQELLYLEMDGRLKVTGPSGDECMPLLQASDLLLLLDASAPELPFQMMTGTPIIARRQSGLEGLLAPSLQPGDLITTELPLSRERAMLIPPRLGAQEFADVIDALLRRPDVCAQLASNARKAALTYSPEAGAAKVDMTGRIQASDVYKDAAQEQWDNNPCGSQYATGGQPQSRKWFREIESYRYNEYAPWMPETMEFDKYSGKEVLEIGGGLGTDLAQFAANGARVTDVDLSAGHLELARKNLMLRGLSGAFVHHDAEDLPFADNTFDLVYCNGMLHHTPNTARVVDEIRRVLKPEGRAIVMVYAQNSWHFWVQIVLRFGIFRRTLERRSLGDIMSETVELSSTNSRPLVKVYPKCRLRSLFSDFANVQIIQRQLTPAEFPPGMRWIPVIPAARIMGWNLVLKADKRA